MNTLFNRIDDMQRWVLIGVVVVLFPIGIPLLLVCAALMAIGYGCEKVYEWAALIEYVSEGDLD